MSSCYLYQETTSLRVSLYSLFIHVYLKMVFFFKYSLFTGLLTGYLLYPQHPAEQPLNVLYNKVQFPATLT